MIFRIYNGVIKSERALAIMGVDFKELPIATDEQINDFIANQPEPTESKKLTPGWK